METQKLHSEALFTQYIHVVNQVIGNNKSKAPFKQILSGTEKALSDKNIGIAVYKDSPKTPHDYYTLKFDDGTFEVVEHGKSKDVDASMKVSQEHLENVAENPKEFIEHPMRLDLDWLRTRIGMKS